MLKSAPDFDFTFTKVCCVLALSEDIWYIVYMIIAKPSMGAVRKSTPVVVEVTW